MSGQKFPDAEIKKRTTIGMLNIKYQRKKLGSLWLLVTGYWLLSVGCAHLEYMQKPYYLETMEAVKRARRQINIGEDLGNLMAGAAKVDITPPIGTPLGGYGVRRDKPSIGIYDRLYARALALSDGEDIVIIVGTDLLAISDDIYEGVFKRVKEEIPSLEREDLLISATHTHSATGGLGKRFLEKFAMGHFDEEIFKFTTKGIARAVIEAYKDLTPARIGSGQGYIRNLSKNRMVEGGLIDPELGLIRIDDLSGSPKAYLINFAAHPTVLGRNNLYISGDYPGWLQKTVEAESREVVAIFTSGASGDIAPDLGGDFPSELKEVKEMGKVLAEKVWEISEEIETTEAVEIISLGTDIRLPPAQIRLNHHLRLPAFIGNLFLDKRTFKNVILINDILLISFPCDLSVEIGLKLKETLEELGYRAYIITLANDYIGYVIPRRYYWIEREGLMAFNGPEMDSYLRDIARGFIEVLEGYR